MTKEHLTRQLRFEQWANRRALGSLKQVDDPKARRLFGHILAAQEAWLARLGGGKTPDIEMFPVEGFSELEQRMTRLASALQEYIGSLSDEGLHQPISYRRNTAEYENTRFDILTHLFMHSHYHRGQIAARVRELGGTPAATDFIVYVREGYEQP